jgi:hypothetical protein
VSCRGTSRHPPSVPDFDAQPRGLTGCIVVGALIFVPESPRWLLLQDRHEEALAVIARLEEQPPEVLCLVAAHQDIRHRYLTLTLNLEG